MKAWLVSSNVAVALGVDLVSATAAVDDAPESMRQPVDVEWNMLSQHQGATDVWQRLDEDKTSGDRTQGGTVECRP